MNTLKEQTELHRAVKYKIRSFDSTMGVSRSSNNNVFYNTFEEAAEKCEAYLRSGGNGFVIMKTVAIIKPAKAPVVTYMVRDSGKIEELN